MKPQAEAILKLGLLEIRVVEALVPICAWCQRVRDVQMNWREIDVDLIRETEMEFTHTICPSCAQEI